MSDYIRVSTSAEVVAVIHARHPEMVVYCSSSSPAGSFEDMSKGVIHTSYGFKQGYYPVIELRSTWDISDKSYERNNLKTEYWLCLPKKEAEE